MSKYKVPEDFDYKAARRLFFEPFDFDIIKTYIHEIEMKKPNVSELLNMLNETKLHKKYIKEIEECLMSYYLNIQNMRNLTIEQLKNPKKKQPLISSYFM